MLYIYIVYCIWVRMVCLLCYIWGRQIIYYYPRKVSFAQHTSTIQRKREYISAEGPLCQNSTILPVSFMSYLILIWREKQIAQKQKQKSQERLELRVSLFCLNEMKWIDAKCLLHCAPLSLSQLSTTCKKGRKNKFTRNLNLILRVQHTLQERKKKKWREENHDNFNVKRSQKEKSLFLIPKFKGVFLLLFPLSLCFYYHINKSKLKLRCT